MNKKIINEKEKAFCDFDRKITALEGYLELTKFNIKFWLQDLKDRYDSNLSERNDKFKGKVKNFETKLLKENKLLPKNKKITRIEIKKLANAEAKLFFLKKRIKNSQTFIELCKNKKYSEAIKLNERYLEDIEEEYVRDKEFLPQFVYQSTIAQTWSILEELLDKLVAILEDCFGRRKCNECFNDKKLPKISIVLKKINNYGLAIDLNAEIKERIHLLRKIRNQFVHSLGSDLPQELLSKIETSLLKTKKVSDINYQLCMESLETTKEFSEKIKKAFEKKYL